LARRNHHHRILAHASPSSQTDADGGARLGVDRDDMAVGSGDPATISLPPIGTRLQFAGSPDAAAKATVVGHDTAGGGHSVVLIYDDLDEGSANWPDEDATVVHGDPAPRQVQARMDSLAAAHEYRGGAETVGDARADRKRKAAHLEPQGLDDGHGEGEGGKDDTVSSDGTEYGIEEEAVQGEAEWATVEPEARAPPRPRPSRPKGAAAAQTP
jgi:hypothetical protein